MNVKAIINYLIIRLKIFRFDLRYKKSLIEFDKIIIDIEHYIYENRMYKFHKISIIKKILSDIKVERNEFEHHNLIKTYIEMN